MVEQQHEIERDVNDNFPANHLSALCVLYALHLRNSADKNYYLPGLQMLNSKTGLCINATDKASLLSLLGTFPPEGAPTFTEFIKAKMECGEDAVSVFDYTQHTVNEKKRALPEGFGSIGRLINKISKTKKNGKLKPVSDMLIHEWKNVTQFLNTIDKIEIDDDKHTVSHEKFNE